MAQFMEVIPAHESWDVIDSSKLTLYMTCPRKYFYKHVLGWTSEYPNNHLVFGSAWHIAMEHLLLNGYSNIALEEASFLFHNYYRKSLPPETDDLFAPKTPTNAVASLASYAAKFLNEEKTFKVVATEIAGQVLIADDSPMAFLLDAVLIDTSDDRPFILDHKTSQRRYSYGGEQWSMSMQMMLYMHALRCLYDGLPSYEILVRSAYFYKSRPTEFDTFTIEKSLDQMQTWLARATYWYNALKNDQQYLVEQQTTDDPVMDAYPMNDTACFNYGTRCAYYDFCNIWSNPIARCERPQPGFKIEYWNPLTVPEVKHRVNLVQLEVPKDGK